jgi:hypothetical protein
MIDYTFLLPSKNDFQYHPARLIRAQRKVFAFLKRSGALAGLGSAVGETRPDGSETKRKNRLTLSGQKGRGFQFVHSSYKLKSPF